MALSDCYENLNIVMLDAHFDIAKYQNTNSVNRIVGSSTEDNCLGNSSAKGLERVHFYECGNFISYLLGNNLIKPQNLWVLGVQDEILKERNLESHSNTKCFQAKEYQKWVKKGVHLLTKADLVSKNFRLDFNGPIYLSIDMDVGSLASVFSARFMNCIGITYKEFLKTLKKLSGFLRNSNYPLVGLDVMEIDIHFLNACSASRFNDRTKTLVKCIFQTFSKDLESSNKN